MNAIILERLISRSTCFQLSDLSLRPTILLKETLAQVFSCKFCEISKNTFIHRTPLVAGSEYDF